LLTNIPDMDTINKEHWEKVFETKAQNEVSWFQPQPTTSIEFLKQCNVSLDANVIDVGGGDSRLVDAFIEMGYKNIYVLDISANALLRAKKRLGEAALAVNWIVSDIVDFRPTVKFDFWHDRAAFHFLTTEARIEAYVNLTNGAINPGGHLVIGTFSEQGPKKCSGLDITQYSETSLLKRFESNFEKVSCITEDHPTPFNTQQNFVFCSFKKK
jgi:2-polyprenyl-3-methyl-5-hydroxy-6-metoxy-1,4-benzoquinol methylase